MSFQPREIDNLVAGSRATLHRLGSRGTNVQSRSASSSTSNENRQKKQKEQPREETGSAARVALREQKNEEAVLRERKESETLEQAAATAARREQDMEDAGEKRVADEAAQTEKDTREGPIKPKQIKFWAGDEESEDEEPVDTTEAAGQSDNAVLAAPAPKFPTWDPDSPDWDMGPSATHVEYARTALADPAPGFSIWDSDLDMGPSTIHVEYAMTVQADPAPSFSIWDSDSDMGPSATHVEYACSYVPD
ncbi:hypothetical protein B2J93_3826 [Marssonina coronariae]|uniref:Uncharacterized protein n=1 Tax=Diplocarpon coronariae TaxID=2795749 RepID=A0A218ZGV0_9HELO|nr:hypothetical protein B2J93_3826 [Marssonina coronariae]